MNLYKVKVSELTDLQEVKKILRLTCNELDTLTEDFLFTYGGLSPELKNKCQYLSTLKSALRVRCYELQDPIYSDGTIDLYHDDNNNFTICESGKKVPIGTIKYIETHNVVPGNISYQIYKPYQGHHYALRALRIVGEQLLENGIKQIYITATNNQNVPSIKTIEEFGGRLYKEEYKEMSGPVPYTCDLEEIYTK